MSASEPPTPYPLPQFPDKLSRPSYAETGKPRDGESAKFLVVGADGMLGTDLAAELRSRGHEVATPSLDQLDIADPESVVRIGELGGFDWVVNCAAYTAVDKAETETREATEVNHLGAGYLAGAVRSVGAKLIHVSTDFVFDGKAAEPYREDAPTHPLGVYGRTKRDGEEAVLANNANALIVRTAWLYGPNGNSFPRTIIRAHRAGKALRVVADQTGCPTYTADLARVLVDLAERNAFPGIYHAVGPEAMTWHEFAGRAVRTWQRTHGEPEGVEIEPIKTEDWPTPAARPKYSVLSTAKIAELGIAPMRPVDEALNEFCLRLASSAH
ncbi:MAG TPA: dTDP-4-dehydrorhamnose reductase [Fimbriimonadaceae bacterium]|nr:dTDP-4-dehydrorhamnose reductase [Fimbriimonadaceae bacterium]